METALEKYTDRFAENYEKLNALFFENKSPLTRAGAFLLTMRDADIPAELLVSCRKLSATVIADYGEGSMQLLPVVTAGTALFTLSELPLSRPGRAYRALTESFIPSPYLVPAAYALAWLRPDDTSYDETAEECHLLFNAESEKHPLATGYEDLCGILFLTLTGESRETLLARLDSCGELITPSFGMKNASQALKFALSFYPEAEEAEAKAVLLNDVLRKKGMRLANDSLACLGALCGVPEGSLAVAERMLSVSERLKTKNGFGLFGVGARERFAWSALLVALESDGMTGRLPAHNALLSAFFSYLCANTADSAPVFHPQGE